MNERKLSKKAAPDLRDLFRAVAREGHAYVRPLVESGAEWLSPKLNTVSQAMGLPWRLRESQREQWLRVLRQSGKWKDSLPPADGPRVLFVTTFGLDPSTTILDSILMLALRFRGARPIGLVCDAAIPACEFNGYGSSGPPPELDGRIFLPRSKRALCQRCTNRIVGPYSLLPIELAKLSAFAHPGDFERLEQIVDSVPCDSYREFFYNGIGVGEHAYGSTARALIRGTLEDNPSTRWQFRRYLISSMLVVDLMERLIESLKPERMLASHGIYVTQGTMVDVAVKHGIPVGVSGSTYRAGTVSFFQGDNCNRAMHSEPNSYWENLTLTSAKEQRLDSYMHAHRNGVGDHFDYQSGSIVNRESIRRMLGLDGGKPIVALFTNLMWDAQILFKSKVYPDMLEWLFETMHYFAQRPEIQLAIRVHPAEGKRYSPTAQPLIGDIAREFPQLPANITIASPDSGVNSFELAEMSDACLIYGAQWGFELAMQGTPVIVTGESPIRGKGFTYDPVSPEEYFRLLDRIPGFPRNSEEIIRRARLYAYHFHFRLSIDVPFDMETIDELRLDDLAPGRSGGLDAICRSILDGRTPFVHDAMDEGASEIERPQT